MTHHPDRTAGPTTATRAFISLSAVAAVSAIVFLLMSFRGATPIWLFNQGESGIWLDEAARVLDGQVMYRDFFEFVSPGVVYTNALLLRLLGPTAAAAQTIPLIVGVLVAVWLWRISSALLTGGWRLFAPVIFICLIYPRYNLGNHKWLAWMFALAAIDRLMPRNLSTGRTFAAGMLLGLAVLCTQDLGAEVAAGVLIGLWPRTNWQSRAALLVGAASGPVLVLGYFCVRAGAGTLWYDLIVFPLTQYRNANGGFALAPFLSWGNLPVIVLQWTISIAAVASGCVWLFPPLRRLTGLALADPAWAIVAWPGLLVVAVQSVTRAVEPTQTTVRCLLLLTALAGVLQALSHGRPRVVRATAGALVAGGIVIALVTIAARQTRPATLVNARAGRIWALAPLPEVPWLQSQAEAGEPVFLFPDKGGLFFLTRTRNATSFPYLQDMGFSSADQISTTVTELRHNMPAAGVFDRSRLYSQAAIESSSLYPLYQFLAERYVSDGGTFFRLRRAAN